MKTFLIIGFIFLTLACNSNQRMSEGNGVISKIEKFKNKNARLPDNLSEIGIVENESCRPVCYKKESESKYIVWFGKELGESTTYNSDTKQWK
jgi:hypothetical protein